MVNAVRTAEDVKLGFAVCSVCHKYFGVEADYLGYVNHDEAARRSVAARRPVVDFDSNADAAIYLQRIARKLAAARDAELPVQSQTRASQGVPGAGREVAQGMAPGVEPAAERLERVENRAEQADRVEPSRGGRTARVMGTLPGDGSRE